jgi:hypothetical protein
MSEPEIARRCTACGLSVRQSAMFCPQCGNPITTHDTTTNPQPVATQALHPSPSPNPSPNLKEKVRHVSSLLIDQAAYDPSLRFLLVAVVLFVLFVVLVLLSKLIG